jgi:hypothetical protein
MSMQIAGQAMIAMPLTFPGFSEMRTPELSSSPACFEPLDPGIISASIPAFFVGRDRDGFWLVRDAKGESGGIFLLKSSALAFARRASRPLGCATIFPSERFELDVKNQGNPLVGYFRPLIQLAMAGWRQTAALIGWIAKAIEHRSKVL